MSTKCDLQTFGNDELIAQTYKHAIISIQTFTHYSMALHVDPMGCAEHRRSTLLYINIHLELMIGL